MAYAAGYVGATPASGGGLNGHALNALALRGVRYERASAVYISGDAYIKRRTSAELSPGVSVSGDGIRHAKPETEPVVPASVSGNGIRLAKPEALAAPGVSLAADEVRRSPARGELRVPASIEHTGEWVQLVKDVEPEPVETYLDVSGKAVRSARPVGELWLGSLTVDEAEPRIRRTKDLWSSEYAEGSINGFGSILARAPLGGYPRGGQQWVETRRIKPSILVSEPVPSIGAYKPAQVYPGVEVRNVNARLLVRPQQRIEASGAVSAPPDVRHRPSPRHWGGPQIQVTGHVTAWFWPEADLSAPLRVDGYASRRSVAEGTIETGVLCHASERVTTEDDTVRVYAHGAVKTSCRVWVTPQAASASGHIEVPAEVTGSEYHRRQTGGEIALSVAASSEEETVLRGAQGTVAPGIDIDATGSGKRQRSAVGDLKVPASVTCESQVVRAVGEGDCAPGISVEADLLKRPVQASANAVTPLDVRAAEPKMRLAASAELEVPVSARMIAEISTEDMAPEMRRTVLPAEPRELHVPGERRVIEVA